MGLSSRPPGSELDEGIQPEGLSRARGTELESGGSSAYAPTSGDPGPLALHEPMIIALLAQCAVATVHRATAAERTIVSQAHELSARGQAGLADAVAIRVAERLGEGPAASTAGTTKRGTSPRGDGRYLSASDIADELAISRAEAYRLVRQMFALREGRVVRVSRRAFNRWVANHTRTPWESETSTSVAGAGGESSPAKGARPSDKALVFEPPRRRPRRSSAGSSLPVGNVQPTQPRRRRV